MHTQSVGRRRVAQQRAFETYCEVASRTDVDGARLLSELDLFLRQQKKFKFSVLNTARDLYKLPQGAAVAAQRFLQAYQKNRAA